MQKSWLQLSIDTAFLQVVLTVLAVISPIHFSWNSEMAC